MEDGISLIMIDDIDWDTLLGPQFIIGIDREVIPVYIGHFVDVENAEVEKEERVVGIWVKTTDYHKIDHNKAYIFIHDYEINDEELNNILDQLEKNINEIEIEELNLANRAHYHIGVPLNDQMGCFNQKYIQ